jgi:hypothetical protein
MADEQKGYEMKIMGYDFKIVSDDIVDDAGAFGRFHGKTQRIQVAVDICEQQKVSTVLHEIIEALNYYNQWELPHHTLMSLEANLYQVLTDNGVDLRPLAKDVIHD